MLEASQKKMDRDVTVTLYLIRHGESRHNSASRNLDFGELLLQQDHGLSVRGASQCVKLAEKISSRSRLSTNERQAPQGFNVRDIKSDLSSEGKVVQDAFKNTLFQIDDDSETAAGGAGSEVEDVQADNGVTNGMGEGQDELESASQEDSAGGTGREAAACDEMDFMRIFHEETPITSSSLTRAIQTAVLGLGPLPSLQNSGLIVLPDAREKGGVGGPVFSADCIAAGRSQLLPRVATALRWVCDLKGRDKSGPLDGLLPRAKGKPNDESLRLEAAARDRAGKAADAIDAGEVKIDVELVAEEAKHHNWLISAINVVESESHLDERCARLIRHLRALAEAAPSKAVICVGHSMLFRRIFSKHLARSSPTWARSPLGKQLQAHALANCGMVALDMDANGAILASRLLFGSGFRAGHFDPSGEE